MTLVVIGTGRLARATCYALAGLPVADARRVVVIGRRAEPTADVCWVAGTRAALLGTPVVFEPVVAPSDDPAALPDAIAAAAPAGVALIASTQSPWERLTAPSAWTALTARAGFGVTLPFQAELAARAAAAVPAGAWLVNACFPDAVNPLLAALRLRVLCGAGNVAIVAAGAQAALGLADQRRLRVLAHHAHLHAPHRADADAEAAAWLDGEPVAEVGKLLAAQRATARDEVNHVTGVTAALLLDALLGGRDLDTHVPGPHGLPGGYPVTARAGGPDGATVELRLPPGVTRADAIARNQRWALDDGVVVDGDRVTFAPDAAAALAAAGASDLAAGFAPADLGAAVTRLDDLRARLRAVPADG